MVKNKDEAYYLMEAKKIIANKISDGSLKKECEKEVKRKRLLPILIPVVSAMAIAGIAVGTYFGLKQPSPTPPPPALSKLLTIEYEYHEETVDDEDADTVAFTYYDNNPGTVIFDWGDGSPEEVVTAYTSYEEAFDNQIIHEYSSAPTEGQTYTITISGELAGLWACNIFSSQTTLISGNLYFKSVTLYKNFNESIELSGLSLCALGGSDGGMGEGVRSGIREINFDEQVTKIPDVLAASSQLETITVPKQITSIGYQSFSETNLTEVIFEEGCTLETIGEGAFIGCDDLRTITIPRTVKTIGDDAFNNCSNLWNVNLHEFNEEDEVPTISTDSFVNSHYTYFVTKSDAVAQAFQNAWGSTLTRTWFYRGASMFFEDTTDGVDGYEFSDIGGELRMDSDWGSKFYFEDDNASVPAVSTFKVTNNLNKTMAVQYLGYGNGFEIPNTYYEEGLIWIKVTYQP